MENSSYILAVYPMSHGFREHVERIAGADATSLTLAGLRKLGLWRMLATLRAMGRRTILYIPLEDRQSEVLLPLLLGMATLTRAGRTVVVRADSTLWEAGRLRAIAGMLWLAFATLGALLALIRCHLDVLWLGACPLRKMPLAGDARDVLYLNANLWFGVRAGGSVGHVAGVVNALADSGYRVDLACANTQVMLRPVVRQTRVATPRVSVFPQELNLLRFHYRFLGRAKRMGADRTYRFLYQRMSVLNFAGAALSRYLGIPLVLEYNGSEVWVARNWGRPMRFAGIAKAIENVCLRHAHRIVVVSRVLAGELLERGVEPERIICYPNGVDPAHFCPEAVAQESVKELRRQLGIAAEETVVGFVGTFGAWHGAPVFARAIRHLVEEYPEWLRTHRVRFAMIGDGAKLGEVRDVAGGPECSPWVVFTGLVPQAETVKYLAACDVLVSPHVANADGSRFFGSPTKLFEYMAMSKGIVASDLDQIGEVLSAGLRVWQKDADPHPSPTAILVRPGNVADLVQGIQILVEQPELRQQLGINARVELLRRYTWRHHVSRILEALGEETTHEVSDGVLETAG
jgi:glycosyltransferase involved in cell wall biosynthesis